MGILDSLNISVQLGSISVLEIAFSLIVAFICSLYILYIYRQTFTGVVYNRSLVLTIVMLALVTAMIIRTINSNLSLSLGMVGALSIVRFRTAIKEPIDTAFMFWAITVGIMSGAGLYLIAIAGTIILGLLFYGIYHYHVKAKSQYLLVVTYKAGCEEDVETVLKDVRKTLKSKSTVTSETLEVTYEIELNDEKIVNALQKTKGVKTVSLLTYQNEIGL